MAQRITADRVFGIGPLERTERYCDQGYLIDIGQCPNGHGEMEANESGQHCGVCNFSTNSKRGRTVAIAQRIAPGDVLVNVVKDDAYEIAVHVAGEPDTAIATIDVAIDKPPFASQQVAHVEVFLEALRATSATGLSPSELQRLVVLMARKYLQMECGGQQLRTLFDAVLRRSVEK